MLPSTLCRARGISPPKACIPCFSLAESGLFNGLQRIQIKKSGRASTRVSGCEQNGSTSQSVHYFWVPAYHIKTSDIRQEKSIGPAQEGECSGLWPAPVGTCGVAMAFQYDRIFLSFLSLFPAFAGGFDRYPAAPYPSLDRRMLAGPLGCARSSFHSRPLRAARRQPLQHHADGIA
jgi:hypothetical protein